MSLCRLQTRVLRPHTISKKSTMTVVWLLVVCLRSAQPNADFHVDPRFNGRLCIPEFNSSLWNFSLPLSLGGWSDIACTSRCSGTPGCMGVFYNGGKKTCLGGSHVFENTTYCTDDPASVYFTLETVPYQANCDGLLPCLGDNMVCWENDKCVCEPGYSLWPSRNACVANCSDVDIQLGDSYQEYIGRRMLRPNVKTYTDLDLDTCKQYCTTWSSDRLCTGVDYSVSNGTCRLNYISPSTEPSKFLSSHATDYYHRNCL